MGSLGSSICLQEVLIIKLKSCCMSNKFLRPLKYIEWNTYHIRWQLRWSLLGFKRLSCFTCFIYSLLKVATVSIMSQILEGTLKQYESKLYNIEKKLCKTIKHKELLLSYKRSKKYPKGMKLKFDLSLCNRNIQLKNQCNKILDTASFRIRDKIKLSTKK